MTKGRLLARSPKSIAGLMEVRGLGIVRQPFVKSAAVALAVQLGQPERLPERAFFRSPPGLPRAKAVPQIVLDGRMASAPARIRLALKAFAKDLFREDFNRGGHNPK